MEAQGVSTGSASIFNRKRKHFQRKAQGVFSACASIRQASVQVFFRCIATASSPTAPSLRSLPLEWRVRSYSERPSLRGFHTKKNN